MDYINHMININLAPAKAKLSQLVNSTLAGEEVIICKNGKPVVRLVPFFVQSDADPCRVIPELTITVDAEALEPLPPEEWGDLIQ